jgi:DNA polymerase-3 subunit chi
MPRVDFYVLATTAPMARERYACRLVEKAVGQGHTVFVRTASIDDARALDTLMWTFSDRSFLPHELLVESSGVAPSGRAPVLIGTGNAPAAHRELLVNLGGDTAPDAAEFARIAEIVDEDPERRRLARLRFKQYRETGCELMTHTL